MILCNILRSPLELRKAQDLMIFVLSKASLVRLTEFKSTWRNAHTHKSLWKMCCLTVHEHTQQLRHFAKLQQEEGSTARDIPGCPPMVNSAAAAWTGGPGQVAKDRPDSLHAHTRARRWRREGVLGSQSHHEQKGSSARLAWETFPVASQSKQQ